MAITYKVGHGLYINMTNECPNRCDFCLRKFTDSLGDADNLWLEKEPTREELWEEITTHNMALYYELVFCGYGEPTTRLDDMLWICDRMRETYPEMPIRVNTNGLGNRIAGQDITPRLKGRVDVVSVSLNYPNEESYRNHCRPSFDHAYESVLEFARLAARHVPTVVMTVLDALAAVDIELCRGIAESCGASFRVREKVEEIGNS